MLWMYSRTDTKLLLLATLLLFSAYGFLLAQDMRFARVADTQLTAQTIGVYASVQGTQESKVAVELSAWEDDLEAREVALASAERVPYTDQSVLWFIALIGCSLLGLILTNFYLDHRRRVSLA